MIFMAGGIYGFKTLYEEQNGICPMCDKPMEYDRTKSHIHHENGNHNDNRMENRKLVHTRCHKIHHSHEKMRLELQKELYI